MTMQSQQLVSPGVSFTCYAAADEEGHLTTDTLPSPDAGVLEQAFENSHDCIALVDLQGWVIYMNLPGACLMGLDGRPPQQPVSWPQLWSPEHRDLADYSIEEARCGHQCRFLACRRMANGLPRWWDIAANPVFDAHGAPTQMFCVCRDVTALKQAECSLQQQVDAKQLLLAEASHRVKNHLSVIAAALALQARCSDNEAVRASLQQAQSRIQAVACIHRRLQQGAGGEPLELSGPLAEIARQAIAALGVEDHIAVKISCPQRLAMATDRAVALLLMTTELMTNALKHAYPDGRTGSVQITVNGTKRELMLLVDDDGRGLPRDFDLHAGSGLGMRIVEGLVAQLHGELQIEPRAPGAHFRVQLPTDEAWNGTRDVVWDAMKQAAEVRSGVS
ncbi:MAG TPA: histidine kinase dimerization/phosphoacceptor domain -containing protein [Steroidobacter sp.]|uniref:sensor histidine kinase n=1 Tax=Steroidobacter sp. TaxID=1978227 RepID=UPI002EDA4A9B